MKAFLMRHCEPVAGARMDPTRGLTAAGVSACEDIAAFLVRQIGRVDIVISSPFKRALQTAEIMGNALGAHVVTTKMLEPMCTPEDGWKEIERLAQASGDVLVVGHQPDLGLLVDMLAGVPFVNLAIGHGSVLCFDSKAKQLDWFVSHEMVAREQFIDAEEAGLIADALEMADAGLELAEALERRSLKHPDHARLLNPIYKRLKKLAAEYFELQGAAIQKAIEPWLKLHMNEAAANEKPKVTAEEADTIAGSILPDTLTPFTLTVTTEQASEYRDLITTAIEKAEAQMESELNSGSSLPETEMTRFIQQNSLAKLTGNLSDTTKQRLRDAIAQTIRQGGTSADIIQTITDTVDTFTTKRAEMIAQTEVNNAYSFGRDGLARAAGLDEKNWVTESDNPCVICIANELQGWIPVTDTFASGDAFPTAHPLCACGCDYRVRTEALSAAA